MAEELLDQLKERSQLAQASVNKYSNTLLWDQYDPSDPDLVFDMKSFLVWFNNALLPSYEGKGGMALFTIEDEIVVYLNRSTAMVQGAKTLIFSLTRCPIHNQNRWRFQDNANFKIQCMAYKVPVPVMGKDKDGNPKIEFKEKNLAEIWLNNQNRRIHFETTFEPDRNIKDPRFLNLWMGYRYSMKAIEEAAQYRSARNAAIEFLKFVYETHCYGSWTYFVYLISWMAVKMRTPSAKMSTAISLFSKTQRVGKGFCWNTFGRLFGQHYGTTTSSQDIVGRWTAFKDNKALIFLDEAFFTGDKEQGRALKAVITEPMQRSENKFADSKVCISTASYVMASNDTAGLPSDSTDARFFILQSRDMHASDDVFFTQMSNLLSDNNDAGYRCLAWILLKGWKLPPNFGTGQKFPETSGNQLQRKVNMGCYESFILEVLTRGWIVAAEHLIDNVPYSGVVKDDARHIWNLHPQCKYKENKTRYWKTFKGYEGLGESAVTYKYENGEHVMVHNWFREGRIDPAHRDVPPAKTWHRIISTYDIHNEYKEFVKTRGYAQANYNMNLNRLLAEMAMYMWPEGHRHLSKKEHACPIITPFEQSKLRAWKRARNQDGIDKVGDVRIPYVVLPTLYMARATAMAKWGDVFDDMHDLKDNDDLNTSNPVEREDIRNYLTGATKRFGGDFDLAFPATEHTFALNEPWPEAVLEVGQVDPVTGMRTRKRKRVSIEDAAVTATRGKDAQLLSKFGTVDDELEILRVTKKAKINNNEEPINKTVYAIEEGDLDFMNGSLEGAFDLDAFLEGAPAANEVPLLQENNTNVMPVEPLPIEFPDDAFGPPLDDSIWTSQLSF